MPAAGNTANAREQAFWRRTCEYLREGHDRLAGGIRFLLSDAASLPFPDEHFGCAAMMDVLHHLDDVRPALAEMARPVKRHGRIVVADFNEEGFALVSRIHQAEGGWHPRSGITIATAQTVMAGLGRTLAGEAQGHLQHVVWFHNE